MVRWFAVNSKQRGPATATIFELSLRCSSSRGGLGAKIGECGVQGRGKLKWSQASWD